MLTLLLKPGILIGYKLYSAYVRCSHLLPSNHPGIPCADYNPGAYHATEKSKQKWWTKPS